MIKILISTIAPAAALLGAVAITSPARAGEFTGYDVFRLCRAAETTVEIWAQGRTPGYDFAGHKECGAFVVAGYQLARQHGKVCPPQAGGMQVGDILTVHYVLNALRVPPDVLRGPALEAIAAAFAVCRPS